MNIQQALEISHNKSRLSTHATARHFSPLHNSCTQAHTLTYGSERQLLVLNICILHAGHFFCDLFLRHQLTNMFRSSTCNLDIQWETILSKYLHQVLELLFESCRTNNYNCYQLLIIKSSFYVNSVVESQISNYPLCHSKFENKQVIKVFTLKYLLYGHSCIAACSQRLASQLLVLCHPDQQYAMCRSLHCIVCCSICKKIISVRMRIMIYSYQLHSQLTKDNLSTLSWFLII